MKKTKLTYSICIGIIGLFINPFITKAQSYSLGVNLATLAVGTINIEVSKAVSQKITLHMPIYWNAVTWSDNKKIKQLMIQPGIRWWKWHSYSGFFGGANLTAVQFNAGLKSFRYYGKGAGITLSMGYAKMLSKRWNIEAEAGLYSGWLRYDIYQRALCGDYEGSYRGLKLYPARISLSLIYIL